MDQVKLVGHGSCLCTFYFNGRANVMIIDDFNIEEKYRNKGWGRKLMKRAIKLAKDKEVDSIELVVNKNNKIAKHLYETVKMEKTKKDYYRLILNKWI